MKDLGKKLWIIPDCYYPQVTTEGPYISHEAICVLNVTDETATIRLTAYYEDKEPDGDFTAVCAARRTNHIRLDQLTNGSGEGLEKGKAYAMLVESDVPVYCQYSRVDTTQERLGVATTMALCGEG